MPICPLPSCPIHCPIDCPNNCPIEARDDYGYTAFMRGCGEGPAAVPRCASLLAAGCDVAAIAPNGRTGLMIAVDSFNASLLPMLLEAGSPVEARDELGFSAFLRACNSGQADCVAALLAAPCNVAGVLEGADETEGTTGLMLAVRKNHAHLLPALLVAGSPMEVRDKHGYTAFLWACFKGHKECAQALMEHKGCNVADVGNEGSTGLMIATTYGRAHMIPLLLSGGAPIEAQDGHGFTAFLWACYEGQAAGLEALMAAGCDLTAVDNNETTGLMLAVQKGQVALMPRLLSDSAHQELEARDKHGFTAFLWACFKGKAECADVLVAAGCDAKAVSRQGYTGLIFAAGQGHAALLPRLVAAGIPLEEREEHQGFTAFLLACFDGKADCVEALLAAGCDVAAVSSKGETGLQIATSRGHTALLPRLLAISREAAEQQKRLRKEAEERRRAAIEEAVRAAQQAATAEAERVARQAEAELMEMLGDGSRAKSPEQSKSKAAAASSKKRAKRERQRQQRALKLAAAKSTGSVPSAMPEPESKQGSRHTRGKQGVDESARLAHQHAVDNVMPDGLGAAAGVTGMELDRAELDARERRLGEKQAQLDLREGRLVQKHAEKLAQLAAGRRQLADERAAAEALDLRRAAEARQAMEALRAQQARARAAAAEEVTEDLMAMQVVAAVPAVQQAMQVVAAVPAVQEALQVVAAVALGDDGDDLVLSDEEGDGDDLVLSDEEGAPLQAAEFERDEGFRVLRRFMAACHMEQYMPLLQEELIGFDALLMCDDADLKELGLRKGVRVKIMGTMRSWAADQLARLG